MKRRPRGRTSPIGTTKRQQPKGCQHAAVTIEFSKLVTCSANHTRRSDQPSLRVPPHLALLRRHYFSNIVRRARPPYRVTFRNLLM